MIRRLPVILAVILSTALAQNRATITSRFGSPSGFGSVLYPGTGHAPVRLPGNITDPSFPGRLGATVRGYPPYRGVSGGGTYGGVMRRGGYPMVLPVPVIIGGGGGYYPYDVPPPGYYQQPAPVVQQQAPPPVVIINQGYQPQTASPVVRTYGEGEPSQGAMGSYQAPVHPMPDPNEVRPEQRAAKPISVQDEKPTIYLIAFKDHTILPALAYWMEGDTLNYITTQGTPNRASIALVDRDFSRQLNRERQVEFSLP